MAEFKVKCPSCGKTILVKTVSDDIVEINAKPLKCPACGEKRIIGKYLRIVDQQKTRQSTGDETQYGPSASHSSKGDETQYAGNGSISTSGDETRIGVAPQAKVGSLVDNMGRTYQLSMGVNSIGRMATTSPATVQINTQDKTMSRNHAIIEVRNAGGQMLHIIKNGANKNPSYLNGVIIGPSDQLILNNGDRIKLGNTELTFKK